jgi:hypothetical protein
MKALQLQYQRGDVSLHDIQARVSSWLGHAQHADTYRIREKVLGERAFKRGTEK